MRLLAMRRAAGGHEAHFGETAAPATARTPCADARSGAGSKVPPKSPIGCISDTCLTNSAAAASSARVQNSAVRSAISSQASPARRPLIMRSARSRAQRQCGRRECRARGAGPAPAPQSGAASRVALRPRRGRACACHRSCTRLVDRPQHERRLDALCAQAREHMQRARRVAWRWPPRPVARRRSARCRRRLRARLAAPCRRFPETGAQLLKLLLRGQ